MTGRTQTLPCCPGGGGLKTTENKIIDILIRPQKRLDLYIICSILSDFVVSLVNVQIRINERLFFV
jgi:hypothetical protein